MGRAVAIVILFVLAALALAYGGRGDGLDLARMLEAPSVEAPMGTDMLGRDVAGRVAQGFWRSLAVVAVVLMTAVPLGIGAGLAIATAPAGLSRPISVLARMGVAIPAFVLALAATAIVGLTPVTAGIAIGIAAAAQYALVTAALGRGVLGEAYARAAVALGVGRRRIAMTHVLPALVPVLRRHVASDAARAVAAYAGLAFIGLGADVGRPDWGALVWEYRGALFEAPWLLAGPVLATTMLATSLHLALD